MVAAIISRIVIVVCGILYPAYSSFKAVRARSHRAYTKWMMYWIVFAIFQAVEIITDTFLPWVPLYYELKILFVLWLVLPITDGSKQLYRLTIHPFLVKHEGQIDQYITQAGQQGLDAVRKLSVQGFNKAATTVVSSAIKGQAVITETLLRAQEAQEQTDGAGGQGDTEGGVGAEGLQRRQYRTSSDSEPFEVIEEEGPTEGGEMGPDPYQYENAPTYYHPRPSGPNPDSASTNEHHYLHGVAAHRRSN